MMKKILVLMLLSSASLLMADAASEYRQKCANCHGAYAKQSALGKSSSIAGKRASRIVKDLKGYKSGRLNKNGMGGLMKAQVKQLSGKQIQALATYISTLPK
jgi:cytochrome c553